VAEVVDEVLGAADIAAEDADGLGEGADLDIDAAVKPEVVDGAATVAAEDAGGVSVIDHHDGAVLFGQFNEGREGADVAFHREDPVGDEELAAGDAIEGGEFGFGDGDIGMGEDVDFGAGEPAAVDDAGVIELIGDDVVLLAEYGRDGAGIGGEAALEDDAGFDVLEGGDAAFEFHMHVERAADGTDRAGTRAVLANGVDGGLAELRVIGKPEIVIGRQVNDVLAVVVTYRLARAV